MTPKESVEYFITRKNQGKKQYFVTASLNLNKQEGMVFYEGNYDYPANRLSKSQAQERLSAARQIPNVRVSAIAELKTKGGGVYKNTFTTSDLNTVTTVLNKAANDYWKAYQVAEDKGELFRFDPKRYISPLH